MPARADQGAAARRPGQREAGRVDAADWSGLPVGQMAPHPLPGVQRRGSTAGDPCCRATQRSARSTERCLLLLPPHTQHGEGLGDKFSVDYIFQAAEKAAGGTPATGVDEDKWLAAFLQARYNLLASWDSTSQASVNRIKIYQELLKLGGCRGCARCTARCTMLAGAACICAP